MSPANDARYQKQWRLDRALGRPRVADAKPVRAHINTLYAARLSTRAIADVAGVSPQAVTSIAQGQPTCRVDTARRILAVTLEAVYARQLDTGFVPNIGARRRIQALMAIGWRHVDITAEMGTACGTRSHMVLHQVGGWVTKATHDAVRAAYDALSMRPGPSQRTRDRARALGYAPPLAWDDDDLDDPYAETPTGWETCAHHDCAGKPDAAGGLCWTHYNQRRKAS